MFFFTLFTLRIVYLLECVRRNVALLFIDMATKVFKTKHNRSRTANPTFDLLYVLWYFIKCIINNIVLDVSNLILAVIYFKLLSERGTRLPRYVFVSQCIALCLRKLDSNFCRLITTVRTCYLYTIV